MAEVYLCRGKGTDGIPPDPFLPKNPLPEHTDQIDPEPLRRFRVEMQIARYAWALAALIFTPGPMVLAATQLRIYWPLAAAGFALMTALMRAL